MRTPKQPWNNWRADSLIATFEELFVADTADKTMYWFGDLGAHVPKYGIPKERIAQAYQAALTALGETHDAFQSDDRYIYRGNIVVDMCRRNDLPIPEHIQRQMPPEELDFNMGGM